MKAAKVFSSREPSFGQSEISALSSVTVFGTSRKIE
jgi:hypothetical protein